jgi:peptidoglycan hydrolase CwlO-like protein
MVAFADSTPESFVKDYAGISWWLILALLVIVSGLLKLVWWLCVRAFEDMKTTNHDTIEELKNNNKEQMEKLERSIDKLDKTIGKAFSRMNDFDDELGDTKQKISNIEGICFERRRLTGSDGCK